MASPARTSVQAMFVFLLTTPKLSEHQISVIDSNDSNFQGKYFGQFVLSKLRKYFTILLSHELGEQFSPVGQWPGGGPLRHGIASLLPSLRQGTNQASIMSPPMSPARKKANDPDKPKRPMNGFMLFAKKFRLELIQAHPGKDNR